MGWLDRFRRRSRTGGRPGVVRGADPSDEKHLHDFIQNRRGVEGFVEPRTTVTEVTLLLVAHDGEWTRRRVPSVAWAHQFCNRNGVPSYDAALVGVPQRMREWNRAQKQKLRPSLPEEGAQS